MRTSMSAILVSLFCLQAQGWAETPDKDMPIVAQSSPEQIVKNALLEADIHINGNRPWDITVHNNEFYAKVLSEGSLGLGESYMDGWWDCPAVDEFISHVLRAKLDSRINISWNVIWGYIQAYILNLQDRAGSMKVIDQHYQLGNDLYKNMLDKFMTYSCGYWKNAATLDMAQEAKFDLICRKLGFQPGMDVLDIGCGWGGFAKYAAEHYGVHVVGITLSTNQATYGQELCKGLPVEIRVEDYRDIKGKFDRIVEIGMFEHVGTKNYREFFEIAHHALKPGGMLMLHTIGSNESSCGTDPWINKYIFPNGHLPSINQIGKAIENLFVMEDWHNFGQHYDKTLMAWHENFVKNWDKIKETYGERFFRMWNYYLLSCAGGFRSREIQLWQVVLSKNGVDMLYEAAR